MSDAYPSVAEAAAALQALAESLAALAADAELPDLYLGIHLQPQTETDEEKVAAIDALGLAMIGQPGELQRLSGGGYFHRAQGRRDKIDVCVYREVTSPEVRADRERIAHLEAELAVHRARLLDGWRVRAVPRCAAAHQSDPRACEGASVVRIVDQTGAETTGCLLHGAVLLASVVGAAVYPLPGAPEGSAIAVFKQAQDLLPFAGVFNGPGVDRVDTTAAAKVFPHGDEPDEPRDDPNEAQLLAEDRAEPDCAEGDEPRCNDCGEPWSLIRSGAVGHCGPVNGAEGVSAQ